MSELKYKVGDKVRIKNIDWYNRHTNESEVKWKYFPFSCNMKKYCGQIMTISIVRGCSYSMIEDDCQYVWTDEMIEGLVERNGKTYPYKIGDRVILKVNNRCATITDLKYNSFGNLSYYIKIDNDKDISIDCPTDLLLPYDNMIECKVKETKPKFNIGDRIVTDTNMKGKIIEVVEEGWYRVEFEDHNGIPQPNGVVPEESMSLVEDETSKFKIDDIVFVKNIGWVRITNSYWDSLANEYIYEAIGFNGEGEYDSINQSNIECQMLSESENPHTCGNKITLDEYKNNDKEWLFNKLATLDNITALESIQDIFNHLQQFKYPKTYEECCRVLGVSEFEYNHTGTNVWYRHKLMATLDKLMLCRDAYWKIAGEEMGLGKPWEPDYGGTFEDGTTIKYVIYSQGTYIVKARKSNPNYILAFPTEEMRDAFYEIFKKEIENCKELL